MPFPPNLHQLLKPPDTLQYIAPGYRQQKEAILNVKDSEYMPSTSRENQSHEEIQATAEDNITAGAQSEVSNKNISKRQTRLVIVIMIRHVIVCGKGRSKIKEHLLAVHKEEEEVTRYILEYNKLEKDMIYERIRNIGNHLHNTNVLKTEEGEFVIAYRPRKGE